MGMLGAYVTNASAGNMLDLILNGVVWPSVAYASDACPQRDPNCCKPQQWWVSCEINGKQQLVNSCGSVIGACGAGKECVWWWWNAYCRVLPPDVGDGSVCTIDSPMLWCTEDRKWKTNGCGGYQACESGYECRAWGYCEPIDTNTYWFCDNKSTVDWLYYGRYSTKWAGQVCPGWCNPDSNGDGHLNDAVCSAGSCPYNSRNYWKCDMLGNIVNGCGEIMEDCTWQWLRCDGNQSSCKCVWDGDVCNNIAGAQSVVPVGYVRDASGNCNPNPNLKPVWKCTAPGQWEKTTARRDWANYDKDRVYQIGDEASLNEWETPLGSMCGYTYNTEMSVTKIWNKTTVQSGDLVTYTITMSNDGAGVIKSSRLDDIVPAAMKLVSSDRWHSIYDKHGYLVFESDGGAWYAREVLPDGRWYYRGKYKWNGPENLFCEVLDRRYTDHLLKGMNVCYLTNTTNWWREGNNNEGRIMSPRIGWWSSTDIDVWKRAQVISWDVLVWNWGNEEFVPNEKRTVTVVMQYDGSLPDGSCITNVAKWGMDTPDINPNNNRSAWTVCVWSQPKADVTITKSVDKPSFINTTGEIITWKLDYKNNGPDAAKDVIITDMLPAWLEFVWEFAPTSTIANITLSGNNVIYQLSDDLLSGAVGSILVKSRYMGGKPDNVALTNVVRIDTSTNETNYDNNTNGAITAPSSYPIVSCDAVAVTVTSVRTATGARVDYGCTSTNSTGVQFRVLSWSSVILSVTGSAGSVHVPFGTYTAQCVVNGSITYKISKYIPTDNACPYKKKGNDVCATPPTIQPVVASTFDPNNVVSSLNPIPYCSIEQTEVNGYVCQTTVAGDTIYVRDDNACREAVDVADPAALGNYVWIDANRNGIQDAGELGLPWVPVKLYSWCGLSGTYLKDTTTSDMWHYLFNSLSAGQYQVRFMISTGYIMTQINAWSDDTDSDANGDGWSQCVTLTANQTDLTVDAGVYKVPTNKWAIGNRVWVDENKDGIDNGEAREPGLPWVQVELYACGTTTSSLATTDTDAQGYYVFDNLTGGSQYYVKFIKPSGYEWTSLTTNGINTDYNSDAKADGTTDCITAVNGITKNTVDAGVISWGTAKLGDRVWHDADRDGIQDAGELWIAGATVELYSCDATPVFKKTTMTDSNGNYLFDQLFSGSYKVKFVMPATYNTFSPYMIGTATSGTDSNAGTAGFSDCITLTNGESNLTIDAGVYSTTTTGGWCDPAYICCNGGCGWGWGFCGDGTMSSNIVAGTTLVEQCDKGAENGVAWWSCDKFCQNTWTPPGGGVSTGRMSTVAGLQMSYVDPPDVMVWEFIPFWWQIQEDPNVELVDKCEDVGAGTNWMRYIIGAVKSDAVTLHPDGLTCEFQLFNASETWPRILRPCNLKKLFETSELTSSYLTRKNSTTELTSYNNANGASVIFPADWGTSFTKLWEYGINWKSITFTPCVRKEDTTTTTSAWWVVTTTVTVRHEKWVRHTYTPAGNNIFRMTVSQPYVVQKNGLSASSLDSEIIERIVDSNGQSVISSVIESNRSLSGSSTIWYLVGSFINKYLALAKEPNDISWMVWGRKVPNKEIYVYQGDQNIFVSNGLGNKTIIVKNGDLTIRGSLKGNVMFIVPDGSITFEQLDGQYNNTQEVEGIYIAKSFNSNALWNNDLDKGWRFDGRLVVNGMLASLSTNNADSTISTLRNQRRSVLRNWFNVPTITKQRDRAEIVKQWGSLTIASNPSLWTNLPPGANELMTALQAYK